MCTINVCKHSTEKSGLEVENVKDLHVHVGVAVHFLKRIYYTVSISHVKYHRNDRPRIDQSGCSIGLLVWRFDSINPAWLCNDFLHEVGAWGTHYRLASRAH